jgi:hypothetical protein
MDVPADPPDACPVCDRPYESVSRHSGGLMVNLLDNERYRRVCFEPVAVDAVPHVDFYHHEHGQTDRDAETAPSTAPGRVDADTADRTGDPVGHDTESRTEADAGPEPGRGPDPGGESDRGGTRDPDPDPNPDPDPD